MYRYDMGIREDRIADMPWALGAAMLDVSDFERSNNAEYLRSALRRLEMAVKTDKGGLRIIDAGALEEAGRAATKCTIVGDLLKLIALHEPAAAIEQIKRMGVLGAAR